MDQSSIEAPHRLLFGRQAGLCVRIWHGCTLESLRTAWGNVSRKVYRNDRLYKRSIVESAELDCMPYPDDLTPKQRLARSRANIRRRAAQSRPRFRRGWA